MTLRLTRVQRIKLFAGECPGITGEGQCPVDEGETVKLSPKLTLKILRVQARQGGWKLHYELRDRRDPVRMIRRTPPVVVPESDDEAPTGDALRRAAQESSYTGAPHSAITDAGEAVDAESQARFTEEGRAGFKAQLERERRERQARSLDARLRLVQKRADEKGIDLRRKLASIEARIAAAEREVGR